MTRPLTERSIRLTGAQVTAVLAGTKTQHRVVLKPQPVTSPGRLVGPLQDDDGRWGMLATDWCWSDRLGNYEPERETFLPLRVPGVGQRLWVREAYAIDGASVWYREGHAEAMSKGPRVDVRWRPSVHMPREFSRITLEVTEVRVQRLQDISEEDARAEGLRLHRSWGGAEWYTFDGADPRRCGYRAATAFQHLWEHINGSGSWEANPWVTALTFRRVEQTEGGHAA